MSASSSSSSSSLSIKNEWDDNIDPCSHPKIRKPQPIPFWAKPWTSTFYPWISTVGYVSPSTSLPSPLSVMPRQYLSVPLTWTVPPLMTPSPLPLHQQGGMNRKLTLEHLIVQLRQKLHQRSATIGEVCYAFDQQLAQLKKHQLLLPSSMLRQFSPFAIHKTMDGSQFCGCTFGAKDCCGRNIVKFTPIKDIICLGLNSEHMKLRQDKHQKTILSDDPVMMAIHDDTLLHELATLATIDLPQKTTWQHQSSLSLSSSSSSLELPLKLDLSKKSSFQGIITMTRTTCSDFRAVSPISYQLPVQCFQSYANFETRSSVLSSPSEMGFCFPLPHVSEFTGLCIMEKDGGNPLHKIIYHGARIGINQRGSYVGLAPGCHYQVGFYTLAADSAPTANMNNDSQKSSWSIKCKLFNWNPQSTAGVNRTQYKHQLADQDKSTTTTKHPLTGDQGDKPLPKRQRAPPRRWK
jgi:hypothetical protein